MKKELIAKAYEGVISEMLEIIIKHEGVVTYVTAMNKELLEMDEEAVRKEFGQKNDEAKAYSNILLEKHEKGEKLSDEDKEEQARLRGLANDLMQKLDGLDAVRKQIETSTKQIKEAKYYLQFYKNSADRINQDIFCLLPESYVELDKLERVNNGAENL